VIPTFVERAASSSARREARHLICTLANRENLNVPERSAWHRPDPQFPGGA